MGLLPSLLAGLRAVCATFPDPRKGRSGTPQARAEAFACAYHALRAEAATVAEIIHPEKDQDTAPPPLSQSTPKTVSAIIKATEGAAPPPPKGVAAHQWPPQRGPPSPLPTFIKFADLKAAGIVANHCALRILIERHDFPKGRWFGSATHVWTVAEVEEWLAERPAERPVPDASTPKRRSRR
jgi:hypothetical protein